MLTPKKILLVEDDPDDQFLFAEAIRELRPTIIYEIANDALEALQKLENSKSYDLIFLDLNLPKMNGFEFLKILKSNTAYDQIPVIIVSTSSRDAYIIKGLHLGAKDFLTKPPTIDQLAKNLAEILDSH